MIIHRSRGAISAMGAVAAGTALVSALAGCGPGAAKATGGGAGSPVARHRLQAGFSWFHPGPAPARWPHADLPDGAAVLSYPGSLRAMHGDKGTVTEGLATKSGRVLVYLNVTPRQGDETLRNWTEFRVDHLTEDDASVAKRDSEATGLRFRGGPGACVMD